ncbi:serine--tRNA ligase [Candidatus Parcubacteria bacterium]|nr:serine--tRNA ligase [Candidatus Parcubacteria bacterium]
MLDIHLIRKQPDYVKAGLKKKGFAFDTDKFLKTDAGHRQLIKEVEELRHGKNKVSTEISRLGKDETLLTEAKRLSGLLAEKEKGLAAAAKAVEEILLTLPNLPQETVPVGKDESQNQALREVGKKPTFLFQPKDHLELGTALGILDFEAGSKVAGADFCYLKNEGILLELALVRYALDFLAKKGFALWLTPDLARDRFYLGTGYLPRGPEAQTYVIENSNLGLIATAEVTLAGIHADEILPEDSLPKRYAGYSHCFRQEAGGYGRYSKGLYRLHQFTKVEMFVYIKPEDSPKLHAELLALEEALWQGLGIPYRVVEMCTGDLGAQAARKFDLEAWMPGRNDWGEVTSTSNTTDYQARRLGIKYRKASGETGYVHTLNGTAIATSRAIIAILENFQKKDGSVAMPKALQPYLGFSVIPRKRTAKKKSPARGLRRAHNSEA